MILRYNFINELSLPNQVDLPINSLKGLIPSKDVQDSWSFFQ